MAAKAARPATVKEVPTVLAAPLKAAMGEPVALGGTTLGYLSDLCEVWRVGQIWVWKTYAAVEAAAVPAAAPEAAAAPGAPTAGTLTGEPGVGGRLPDGEEDPDPAASATAGVLAAGELPAAAGVGVAVTVTEMVTGEQDGQVGHADEPAAAGGATTAASPGAGTTGGETAGRPVVPACAGTGTAGTTGGTTAAADGEGVAMTGGPTKKVEDAPACSGLGLGLEVATGTGTTGTTTGVLRAGQFLTVGAQLVRISSMVLKAVASATGLGAAGALTCS